MPSLMHIGTAGYVYPHWRKGAFYPLALPHNKELAHYFHNFSTVEINTTWHAFPRRETLQKWRATAPKSALLALKAPKLITHEKRLRNATQHIVAFCKLAVDELHSNLGPLLFQCPPSLPYSPLLLDAFIDDIDHAREACHPFKLSVALDLRDRSWYCHHVFQRLAQSDIALVDNIVVHDHDQTQINHNHFPNARQHTDVPTATWRYVRFHGSKNPSVLTDFPECVLTEFAKRTVQQRKSVEFTFFLNDWGALAPKNAKRYAQLVAKERGVSVKTLFDGFWPLWCKKRPSISSFFAANNASGENEQPVTKKRKVSAPSVQIELDKNKIDTQPAILPVVSPAHQSAVSIEEGAITIEDSDSNECHGFADQNINSDEAPIVIPEMPSESEESTAGPEATTATKGSSSSTLIQHKSDSQAQPPPRKQSSPSSKSINRGAKWRLKPSPGRKGKRTSKTRVNGVADIASFFAPASEKG